MKEISIIAATFYGNRGAEAMLSTTIGKLREGYGKDLGFNVYSYYPQRDTELISDPKVHIHSSTPTYLILVLLPCAVLGRLFCFFQLNSLHNLLPKSVKALSRSEALICLAGVSFIDGRTKFLPFNIATILPAMLLRVPVIKFAQAMGPFNSFFNRMAAQFFLGHCHFIFTRGEITQSYLSNLLNKKRNFQRADDVAFLFKPEFCLSEPAAEFELKLADLDSQRASGRLIIGICPSIVIAKRSKAAGWNYPQRMHELITKLVQRGYSVALYPNATRGQDMDKLHNNDLPLLKTILQELDSNSREHVIGFTGSLNAAQIHHLVNACDVQAVSRFHAMVAALSSAVPVMVIGWSHKYLEVMKRFSQEDMVLDYKEGNVTPIIESIERLIAQRRERSEQIASALQDVQSLSNCQFDYVLKLLKSN